MAIEDLFEKRPVESVTLNLNCEPFLTPNVNIATINSITFSPNVLAVVSSGSSAQVAQVKVSGGSDGDLVKGVIMMTDALGDLRQGEFWVKVVEPS